MANSVDFKRQIEANLLSFLSNNLRDNALQLFKTLGYKSDKRTDFEPNTKEGFKAFLKENGVQVPNEAKAHLDEWQSVDFLFQLTNEEISQSKSLFDSNQVDVSDVRIESYLFFAIKLKKREYKRSELAEITREINRTFPMPVMILFQHGNTLTFSIIDRRLHKRDESKDVLSKVTLIKDIRLENPHHAHVLILADLALENLDVRNFVELHKEWQRVLDTKELNKKFFQELANWYFWAVENVTFPDDEKFNDDEEKDIEIRNATSVIRLITRLMFVWFLKEKGLVSEKLFDEKYLKTILKFQDESAFYKAILQNLFFATLNSTMGTREFRKDGFQGKSQHYGIHNVFRYRKEFIKPEETIKELFEPIPFLNGGLFECLDKKELKIEIDGFSDRPQNVLQVPDKLFFGNEREVDLSKAYGDTKKAKSKVRGLINILDSYKFTIAENTPIEEEIALDPELLGKVFENLLASYNPETKTTARKQTGSFYTPREIVNYMVDESLIAYLKAKLQTETEGFGGYVAFGENQATMFGNEMRIQQKFEMPISNNRWHSKDAELETALRDLFNYTDDKHQFNELETEILIKAIDNCKILDPACGSGAFPMGILHRLVHLLKKLDKDNAKWKQWQKQKAIEETKKAFDIGDSKEREDRLLEINDVFENNASDYGRKLFLIENCIYGVDIQPIAIQIAKLRFFISLIVDEKTSLEQNNLGIRPLPNLETKFVAANTLIGIKKDGLIPAGITDLEKELKEVRAKHFSARTRRTKEKYRQEDKRIRGEIAKLLKTGKINDTTADLIADWNPYDQNAKADWFDAEYMFGIEKGFDIVIGNPPYIGQKGNKELFQPIKASPLGIKYHQRRMDLFYFFFHFGLDSLKKKGIIAFVTTNYYLTATYADKLRKHFYEDASIINLINFNELIVFESAQGQHNLITILSKGKQSNVFAKTAVTRRSGIADTFTINSFLNRTDEKSDYYYQEQDNIFEKDTLYLRIEPIQLKDNSETNSDIYSILNKIRKQSQLLSDFCFVEQGIVSGADKVSESLIEKYPSIKMSKGEGIYILTGEEVRTLFPSNKDRIFLKQTYKNSDLEKWIVSPKTSLYVLYIKSNSRYFEVGESVKSHLDRFKLILINRNVREGSITEKDYQEFTKGKKEISYIMNATSMKNGNFYCLSYPRRGSKTFEVPKIVNSRRAKSNNFAFENDGFYEQSDIVISTLKPEYEDNLDLKFILGILNSKLIYKWLYYKGKRKGELLELFQKPLTEIPIKLGSLKQQTDIAEIVEEIIKIKKQNTNTDISKLECKIDKLVYQLYGLTDEEIRIVEGKDSN